MANQPKLVASLIAGAILILLTAPTFAQSDVERFYTGKVMRLIIGYSVGGGFDGYARLLAHHLPKHLSGHPTIIPENMPGAGALKAANYLYSMAPKDGTVMGTFHQQAALQPLFGTGTFDPTKFYWIGSLFGDAETCVFSTSSAIASWHDMLEKDHVLGGMAEGTEHVTISRVLMTLFHTRSRLVTGYNSATELALALQRGEIDGFCGQGYGTFVTFRGDLLRDKKARFVLAISRDKIPELANLPNAVELATTEEHKKIISLILGVENAAKPFAIPPGVSQERVAALRKAFDDTVTDPEFLAEAQKQKLVLRISTGAAVQEAFATIYNTPRALVDEAARISGMK